ncbi:MAG: RecQ family ATP-dependent DNA helicase [Spirochaetia bacterium]|nr:RecQ family ATP-dependent DNA helicase [Spirochaetia bacterium]
MLEFSSEIKAHFGLDSFRPGQREAIESILALRDTVALLPTGGGKSLIYQLPAVLSKGITLVVSPLIALMKDQVDALVGRGIAAAYCNSTQDEVEQMKILSAAVTGKLRLLFISPEKAVSHSFLQLVKRMNVSLIAVDEAHCVSKWGHDFRPEFRQLHTLREVASSNPPICALTATATTQVIDDITKALRMKDPQIIKRSFFRPNLAFSVQYPENEGEKEATLLGLLEEMNFRKSAGKCIIYCSTRAKVDRVCEVLREHNFRAGKYHAGRTSGIREKTHDSYSTGKLNVLAATNAFGMGMDDPDVRLIVHYQVPSSIEAYFQEAGRAGRNGNAARCVLFYANADFVTQNFILGKERNQQSGENLLRVMREYGMSSICRQKFLCNYFGESVEECGTCDVCSAGGTPEHIAEYLESTAEKRKAKESRSHHDFTPYETEIVAAALKRYPGVFGKKIIAGMLHGSKARDILKYRLVSSDLYAKLPHISADAIIKYLEDQISSGQIKIAGQKYPKIYLAGFGPQRAERGTKHSSTGTGKPKRVSTPESELIKQLKNYRDNQARKLRWKKFMVMQNAIIVRIARARPTHTGDLLTIKGFGAAKADRFGEEILRIVHEHPDS